MPRAVVCALDKKKYIQTVTEQIRCKRALPLVTKELEGHIEDQKSDYMKEPEGRMARREVSQ